MKTERRRVYLMDLPLKELERLRETMYVQEPLSEHLERSGQEPRHASPEEDPHSLSPSVSAPAVLTDYAGASCPVRFRWQTYAGVMFVMAACLVVAFLSLHFNHG